MEVIVVNEEEVTNVVPQECTCAQHVVVGMGLC